MRLSDSDVGNGLEANLRDEFGVGRHDWASGDDCVAKHHVNARLSLQLDQQCCQRDLALVNGACEINACRLCYSAFDVFRR